MGLFNFVANVGKSLGIGSGEDETAAAADAKIQELRAKRAANTAKALKDRVAELDLPAQDIEIEFENGRARVEGEVATQADREKIILALGNVKGVAEVEDTLQVEADEPEATFYTVESGDTLWKIAERHYGNGSKYPEIFEANRPLLSDPDKIYPGQTLRIPALAEQAGGEG